MSYTTSKWIEDGPTSLEIQTDDKGLARFVLHRRIPEYPNEPKWEPIHFSGLYADAESAEADGVLQRDQLRRKAFASMTVNERLVYAGLMDRWDLAVRNRNRQALTSILSEIDLSDQAEAVADAAMSR
jgi:hypothetical protein